MAKTYHLRCKYSGQKRFSLVDWSTGKQVALKFYASRFTETDKIIVQQDLNHEDNKHIDFQWQKIA